MRGTQASDGTARSACRLGSSKSRARGQRAGEGPDEDAGQRPEGEAEPDPQERSPICVVSSPEAARA